MPFAKDLFYRIKAISDTAAPILAGLQARNSNFDASKCPDIYGSFSNLARAQQQLNQEYLAAEANTTAHGKGRQLVPLLDEMENYLMVSTQQAGIQQAGRCSKWGTVLTWGNRPSRSRRPNASR